VGPKYDCVTFCKTHDEDTNGIRVVIRIRPDCDSNLCKKRSIFTISQNSIKIGSDNCIYTYDDIVGPEVDQNEMYMRFGKQFLDSSIIGYNATIFCYGSTGSGKTYTMTGSDKMDGLIPNTLQNLFANLHTSNTISYNIMVSYLEIYKEKIYDLLKDPNNALTLHDDPNQGIFVKGLTNQYVCSAEDAIQYLKRGLVNRRTKNTLMNNQSSRSHAIFTIKITSQEELKGEIISRSSHLNLVDLAGSERMKSTGVEGALISEACSINTSLSDLGHVILGLSNKNAHVNYRNSKLTHLLKHSLGGNCKTLFIANISSKCTNETDLSTLKFVKQLKYIKNQPNDDQEARNERS
jgi:hypothetical protein